MHRSQSAKIQRAKSRQSTPKRTKKVSKKPAWDDSVHDLSQYRLSKEELNRKKLMSISKNSAFVGMLSNSIIFLFYQRR